MSISPLAFADSLRIGTVDFVSSDEIKVLLNIEAPDSLALNTGTPRSFPRVNSYVLILSDAGYLVGQIEWITIERSAFPKRKGLQDFGLIDLPFPLRKMSLNPIGTLVSVGKDHKGLETYSFRRGVDSFPSVGNSVLLPTQNQLHSIVESGSHRRVKIGTSLLADNADIMIDPNRLFGRHLAVLGNTGSGKSCSVAGLIRWSLESAKKECTSDEQPNARFIILDPNGEYSKAFQDMDNTRVFSVKPSDDVKQLQVPLWFWNSAEWSVFTQASGRAQRPALQQALRQRRNSLTPGMDSSPEYDLYVYLHGIHSALRQQLSNNAPFCTPKEGQYWGFIELLNSIHKSLIHFSERGGLYNDIANPIATAINALKEDKCKNDRGYNKPFEYGDVNDIITFISNTLQNKDICKVGFTDINEDTPIPFVYEDLLTDIDFIATNSGNRQWFDSFLARIRTILSDNRMKTIIGESDVVHLGEWLEDIIGGNMASNGTVTIIDLSLVPSEVIHIITAVIARMILEALQRYRKLRKDHKALPTVMVMEEAHTFVKRYKADGENQDASAICCQIFERIAREGRKYGLGLVLSSQRPSELSQTVLSQCNTFLLHRISNDRDQELVQKLVPDNLRGLLRDLPSLPSQNAILLGWASELPVLVRMNHLPKEQQPQSDDPDFWEVWTGKAFDDNGIPIKTDREVNWKKIADDWQHPTSSIESKKENSNG